MNSTGGDLVEGILMVLGVLVGFLPLVLAFFVVMVIRRIDRNAEATLQLVEQMAQQQARLEQHLRLATPSQ